MLSLPMHLPLNLFVLVVIAVITGEVKSFHVQPLQRKAVSFSTSSTGLQCICIDCKYVTTCQGYHFVEEKHKQPHITENPTFEPQDGSPTIHVNIRNIRDPEDLKLEVERMWREHETETEKAETQAAIDGRSPTDALYGKQTYNFSSVTTYEYDVVKCADFTEDKGAWVRNMPQAIRDANPNFVPS
jgi:hypothetical protein